MALPDWVKDRVKNGTELRLTGVGLFDKDMEELVKILELHPHITLLIIDFNNINSAGAKTLALLTHVDQLNIESNNINDEGALALVKNDKFKEINLSRNGITDAGAKKIAQVTTQHILNLDHNNIDEQTKTVIDNRLAENKGARGNTLSRR